MRCIEKIKQFDLGKIQMEQALEDVKELLGCASLIPLKVHFFIGFFEGNPYVAPLEGGEPALAWPAEVGLSEVILRHELAHLVHNQMANLKVEWERPVAQLILEEDIAMHTSKILIPGKEKKDYLDAENEWINACDAVFGQFG